MDKTITWIQKILRICAHMDDYTAEDAQMIFPDIHHEYVQFSVQEQQKIKDVLLSQLEKRDLLFVLSILIKNGAADVWMPLALQVVEALDFDPVIRSMLEVQVNAVSHTRYLEARAFHANTVQKWEKKIPIMHTYKKVADRNQNRIVIVTEQLISELHAPTKSVLEMAYLLKHVMGYEVLLVVLPCNAGEVYDLWYKACAMNADDCYETAPIRRSYKGEEFFGYQVSMEVGNVRDYSMILSYILEWNPLFVFSMGTINPVADVLSKYTTVVAQSMSTVLPVSEAQILIDLGENDALLAQLPQKFVRFSKVSHYFGEPKMVHTREMYGIKDGQFVCVVVGNRLEQELDEAFIHLVQSITRQNHEVAFVFIGGLEEKKKLLQEAISQAQLYFIDYCTDLLGIYRIMDLYVNPDRNGGGYSAAMALASSLPVITLDHGDVALHAGSDFLVPDYNEMQQEILHYAEDSMYRALQQKQAEKCAESMTEEKMYQDMQNNINKIIKEIR